MMAYNRNLNETNNKTCIRNLYGNKKAKASWRTCLTVCLLLVLIFTLFGCTSKDNPDEINIAEQFGIAYAPLQIMRDQQLLEQALPGVKINWKQYGGPAPIREGMLAGEIDFGFMGAAPVLIGIDKGMPWKYATGISANQVALVTDRPEIQSLRDFSEKDRIAILSPGSTQHILLSIACFKEFGDPNKFDSQIVSLSHPDAMDALIADTEIVAHFATSPYIDRELQQGMHIITTAEEIMGGPFTFITGVALISFYEEKREYYDAILLCLDAAIDYINNHLDEAVAALAPIYGVDEATLKAQMTYHGTIYSNELTGIEKLADMMYETGTLDKPLVYEDAVFPKGLKD